MDLIQDIQSCYGKTKKEKQTTKFILEVMDPVSRKTLKRINKFKLPLTDIYLNFKKGNCGCAGSGNITEARISKIYV